MKKIIFLLILPSVIYAYDFWWWIPEYGALVKYIRASEGVSASFPTSTGDDHTKISLYVTKGGLVLIMDMPSKAIYSVDKKGKKYFQEERHTWFLKDSNLDGKLDYYKMKEKSYIKFKGTKKEMSLQMQWVSMMAFSVNNFLHGIPNPYPRE